MLSSSCSRSRIVPQQQGRLLMALQMATARLGRHPNSVYSVSNSMPERHMWSRSHALGHHRTMKRGATPFYILPGALLHIGVGTTRYPPVLSQCDVASPSVAESSIVLAPSSIKPAAALSLRQRVVKAFRMLVRAVQLAVALTPLLFLYPILQRPKRRRYLTGDVMNDHYQATLVGSRDDDQAQQELDWFSQQYLRFCLRGVEWSGATVIKLMQWLSSRPDLVGQDFCSIFSKLQNDTTPHAWRHTKQALEEAYGKDWPEHIRVEELIGSGCIGQVYKGYVKKKKNITLPNNKGENYGENHGENRGENRDDVDEIAVAIKVLHPSSNISTMETDLDWMRLVARLLPHVSKPLEWLNPTGAVEEFGRMLTLQLDLRHEARNLQRFQRDFANDKTVLFPELVLPDYAPTCRVLVETYMEGVPMMEFVRQQQLSKDDAEIKKHRLRQLCIYGIQAVCKMLFWHNFCHGDLHPGNVLVTPNGKQLILLDVGIVNEYTNANHDLIVNVLTSFIRHDGRKAAHYMMMEHNANQGANNDGAHPMRTNEEVIGYVDTIGDIADQARSADYMMENLGSYISQICEAAAHYHVLMNQSFVSAALAVKVQEGIVLSLDPSLEIWRVANPIILEGEARRQARKLFSSGDGSDNAEGQTFVWPQWVKYFSSSLPTKSATSNSRR